MAATKLKEWFLRSKRTLVTGVLTFFILICSFIFTPVIFADGWWDEVVWTVKDIDKGEAVAFLKNDWIQFANVLGMILQSIEGWIVQGLFILVSSLEDLIPKTFSFFDLLKDTGLTEFATSIMKGLFYALLLLVIVWLAIKTIIQHKPPRFKSVGVNIIVMIGLLGGLNELMADMQKMATDFYNDTTNDKKTKEGLAFSLVKHNTADLAYLSTVGFGPIQNTGSDESATSSDEGNWKNGLSEEMYLAADLGDIITPDVVGKLKKQDGVAEQTKFLEYKVTNSGADEALESIDGSFFNPFKDTFPSGYIRYPMNFFTISGGLIALGVAYLFTIFVFVMAIFEIAMKKIIAPIVFVTDLETGEKTKMVVQDIARGFMLIGFTGLSLRFYTIAVNFLSGKDINAFLYIVAMICLTGALIKGSDSILRYFGVDVGLKEGKNNLMAAVGMFAAANEARKGLGNMAKNAKNRMASGYGMTREDTPKRSEESDDDKDKVARKIDRNTAAVQNQSQNQSQNQAQNFDQKAKTNEAVQSAAETVSEAAGTKSAVKTVGSTLSYIQNRGVGGIMNDASNMVAATVSDAVEKGKGKVTGVAKGVSDGVKGTIGEFKEGQAEGKQKAEDNNDRQLLNRVGKDIHKNANSGTEQSGNPKMEDASGGNKQQVERELDVVNRMNNRGNNEVPNEQATGDCQQVERELDVANRLNNTGQNEMPNDQAQGDRQRVERELDVANRLNNTGQNEMPNEQAKGDRQRVERELDVANRMNNTGQNEMPNDQAQRNRQRVEREVDVANRMNNTGQNEMPNDQAQGNRQRVEREVDVANRMNNTGQNEMPNDQAKGDRQQVEREINVTDRLNNVGGSAASQNNVKPESSTVQREVSVQNNVNGAGAVNSNDVNVNGATVQREVNVQNNVNGAGAVNSNDVNVNGATVQREVSVQNNVNGAGAVNSSDVNVNGTTVQREVSVQNNVSGAGAVTSGDVNVNGATVQREVNVQNNVTGAGAVNSGDVSVNGATVQREVNVQNNVNGTEAVNSQDLNIQGNTKEVRKSGLRQRGSRRNRTDQLRRN